MPPNDLPSDFDEIPADSPKAGVLVSVPGTPQASEALIANQIPQTAAISREAATLHIAYYGENNVYAETIAVWANPSRNYASADRILGGRGFAYKRKGNDSVIASNDLYADHDGNIYRASSLW